MTVDILTLNDIACRYDDRLAVRGLSLKVPRGDIVCLLGPSGCGKTTVLRAIAGFHGLEGGDIRIGGRQVSTTAFTLPPEKRKLGVVFQDYALFPHLTVAGNVGFALRDLSRAERKRVVDEMLALIGLPEMADRYPHELSGGQQQRVALARALAARPDLVLLDEPFSSLDVELRERLSLELREILKRQGTSAVLVTHDQHEAFAMGDNVGIMQDGRLVQWDTPYNLYHQPCCRFVADFIGQGVFLKGTLLSSDTVETEIGVYKGHRPYGWSVGTPVEVLLRPDDIIPDPEGPLRGEIVHKAFKGAEILYTLRLPTGGRVLSLFPSHADHELGHRVGIRVQADHLIAFALNAPGGTQAPPA
ncbi:MAG: ABC transporter ATP-binding protein [Pseudomonadota bacterium]